MQNKLKSLIFITTLLFASNVFAQQLSDAMVNDLVKKLDIAIDSKDSALVETTLSDDINITINIENQGKKQVVKLTKQQYVSSLDQGWKTFDSYSYNRSNLVIKIQGNKATLTMDIVETITLQGQKLVTKTKEESIIELVSGEALFTHITGYSAVQ